MKVVQICIGKFHHFHLARYLHARGELESIYSGYPWFKLKNEQLPRTKVRAYPWWQTTYLALGRSRYFRPRGWMKHAWEWKAHETLDAYAARTLPGCDVVVGLSGSALRAGRRAQANGATYVCDRGSSHIRHQDQILRDEHERWGAAWPGVNPRIIEKEEAEYQTADLITVPSEFAYQSFVRMGVPSGKVAKIPYGANIARFSPQGEPPTGKFVVLFVGQVSLRKGIPYLLNAFAKFKHPNKELWIVGARTPGMETVLRRLPLERVEFLGVVPNTQLSRIYSQAHVFVLPSVEEGLAMVQGEALACGCPVISTENTGAADLFTDGREGFIVGVRDTNAIAERLEQLASDEPLRQEMSQLALQRVQQLGGWHQYGELYRSRLQDLLRTSAPVQYSVAT